ncbi:P22AR C-terminal domain-containing protein [Salipaludibacillus sp. CF4.18]
MGATKKEIKRIIWWLFNYYSGLAVFQRLLKPLSSK